MKQPIFSEAAPSLLTGTNGNLSPGMISTEPVNIKKSTLPTKFRRLDSRPVYQRMAR